MTHLPRCPVNGTAARQIGPVTAFSGKAGVGRHQHVRCRCCRREWLEVAP